MARPDELAASSAVRVTLTSTGVDSLGSAVGAGVTTLDGVLVSVTPDAIALKVDATFGSGQGDRKWNGESVSIPRKFVSRVEQAKLSQWRTGAAAVGVIALGVAINGGIGGHGGGLFGSGSGAGK